MQLQVQNVAFFRVPMHTRFPFRYGIATLTQLPHLFVRAQVKIDGVASTGMSADGLPPKWFTKNPETSFEEDDLPQMLSVIRSATDIAVEIGAMDSFFDWWWRLYDLHGQQAEQHEIPPLLASFGVSLIERAVLDALCRHVGQPLHQVATGGALGIEFARLFTSLAGIGIKDTVTSEPRESLIVRHTVGMADPLTDSEIGPANRLNDGLPHSLEASIRQYGLTHFKIKLLGDLSEDRQRLREIATVITREVGEQARFTLDGNENYRDIQTFREHWNTHRSDPELQDFFSHSLLFVEQPLHRDVALKQSLQLKQESWQHPPRVIIDESDAKIGSFATALHCGYCGTSHKNCKGVVKSMLNAAVVADVWRLNGSAFLSAEDLANVGPVALLQDLAVVAMLGVDHVERNGHHFFAGLSMFPESEQQRVLDHHPDLYERSATGFATLKIRHGRVSLGTVNSAPFGVAQHPDVELFEEWHF